MLSKHQNSQSGDAFSGSSADQLISYLKSRSDILFMCLFDSMETKLLSTANKGRPTNAQKLFEMKQMSDNNKKLKGHRFLLLIGLLVSVLCAIFLPSLPRVFWDLQGAPILTFGLY
jgi:hypothetical protein